jgi:arabinose-5-phosphate isomerase
VMHTGDQVPLAHTGMPMDRALVLMTEKSFGCLGVTGDDGALHGIITDGDLRRAMGPDLLTRPVNEVMTRAPRTIGPDALAAEALHAMNAHERPVTALFVVEPNGKVVGILHIHDLLRAGLA